MQVSVETGVYLLGLASMAGASLARLSALEKKVDKHNHRVERMTAAERDLKTLFRHIDELKEECRHEHF